MADAAEEVDLPGGVEADVRLLDIGGSGGEARRLLAAARIGGFGGDVRRQVELAAAEQRPRRLDPVQGHAEVEIGAEAADDQGVQLRIAERPPPGRRRRLAGVQARIGRRQGHRRLRRGVVSRPDAPDGRKRWGRYEARRGGGEQQTGEACHELSPCSAGLIPPPGRLASAAPREPAPCARR